MGHSPLGVANRRFALAISLSVLASCTAERAEFVPSHDAPQRQARVVSTVVNAGGRSYRVEEIYTPSESNLQGIAPGPRGHIWFTGDALVGKSSITSDMLEFLIPVYGNATSITEGPDQNLWITLYPGAVGRVSTNGRFTAFPIDRKLGGTDSNPFSIIDGPDKALWFVTNSPSKSDVVRMTVTGKMRAYRVAPGSQLQWLTADSHGALWFTAAGTNKIGRMSEAGTVREFSVPTPGAGLSGICQGPDGNIWFLEQSANKVGSLTSSGSFHEFDIPTPSSGPASIVAGSDGALWFTEESVGKIGRITTSGSIVELKLSDAYARPFDITVGSDQNIWFTESQSSGIMGRVELHNVKGSSPKYSTITLSLGKNRPQLGVSAMLPLSIVVRNLAHHMIKGEYPNPIHLTTTDSKNAALSETTITSSDAKVSVLFSGHYTNAAISANADGGGTIYPATVLPSAPREKKLPNPGYGLTPGPNDTLWMCLANGKIASYSPSGPLHVYRATTSFTEEGCSMLEGPDGNIWFTDYSNNRIGRITPTGVVTFFPLGSDASPLSMALGSDGALWFTESITDKIGRLTTDGQLKTFNARTTPYDIVAGPDGNLWYNGYNGTIYRMTTEGKTRPVRTVYEMGGLWSANNELWFYTANGFHLEEMSTKGSILQNYSVPTDCLPFSLTSGPTNSMWYVDPGNDCVARMTLSGKFIIVPTYSQKNNPGLIAQIVVGPDNDLWFTETGNKGLGWLDPTTI